MKIGTKGLLKEESLIEINGKQYTNRHNLPEEIVTAITRDRYTNPDEAPSDFSATTIIQPIQMTILKKRHAAKPKDISDESWSFFGSVCHERIEEASNDQGGLTEVRLYATVLGKTISGKMDRYIYGTIKDWKFTKVYKWQKKDYSDWAAQMNILAFLLRENDYLVKDIKITMFLRDWTKANAYKPDYPKCEWQTINIPLWAELDATDYVTEKVKQLTEAESLTDKELFEKFPCTAQEQWSGQEKFAVQKKGAKKATRVFDTRKEAEEWWDFAYNKDKNIEIVARQPLKRRCEEYCDVSHVCHQRKVECGQEAK